MNIELAEYIIKELGDNLYDELEIEPDDYNRLPAYEFYQEVIESCEALKPEIISNFRKMKEQESGPNSAKEYEEQQKSKVASDFETAFAITKDVLSHTAKYRLSKIDYANVRFYRDTFLNFSRTRSPKDVEQYLLDHSKEKLPRSPINCNRMRQFIFYLAKRYRKQYGK